MSKTEKRPDNIKSPVDLTYNELLDKLFHKLIDTLAPYASKDKDGQIDRLKQLTAIGKLSLSLQIHKTYGGPFGKDYNPEESVARAANNFYKEAMTVYDINDPVFEKKVIRIITAIIEVSLQ
jgi:hypothetical protein